MAVAGFVILHGAVRRRALGVCKRHKAHALLLARGQHGKLQIAQRLAHVAAAAFCQPFQRAFFRAHRHALAGKAAQGILQPQQNVFA